LGKREKGKTNLNCLQSTCARKKHGVRSNLAGEKTRNDLRREMNSKKFLWNLLIKGQGKSSCKTIVTGNGASNLW